MYKMEMVGNGATVLVTSWHRPGQSVHADPNLEGKHPKHVARGR